MNAIKTVGGKVIDTPVRAIPALAQTCWMKGETGSAWRGGMVQKNALAPRIVVRDRKRVA
ncbi:hypothetical protein [Dickeya dianthicola]|uniref:hypothetical protein n=1 Tax=Dickeya dianthicola TaxID=204039 RepID=UPI003017F3BC